MQYENENMDDLFRRAAENYPLDTSSKDWNKVLQALQNGNSDEPNVVRKKNNNGRFLWLLLLLPLGFVCNRYFLQDAGGDQNDNSKKLSEQKQPSATKTSAATPAATEKNTTPYSEPDLNSNTGTSGKKDQTVLARPAIPLNARSVAGGMNNSSKKQVFSSQNETSISRKINRSNDDLFHFNDLSSTGKTNSNLLLMGTIPGRDKNDISIQPLSASFENIVKADTKTTEKTKQKNKRFYAGVLGGVDATTIKFQKIESAGYDYGAILGYDLAKKWSVEAGLFLDRKTYYSDGQYFNTSKLWMPPNSKITEVSGICKMIEVPLTVKYTFSSPRKHSWFATAGTSSYFMKEEDYNSTYYYANTGTSAEHYKEYKNSSTNLFSVAQISGGYTRKIGKAMDLRVEPYLKLPLSGMGIGKLPFTSAGLHVGVTRKLF